jgi:hypothetical protein
MRPVGNFIREGKKAVARGARLRPCKSGGSGSDTKCIDGNAYLNRYGNHARDKEIVCVRVTRKAMAVILNGVIVRRVACVACASSAIRLYSYSGKVKLRLGKTEVGPEISHTLSDE